MKTIWEFPLDVTDSQELVMPENAKILSVQTQYNVPVLYAMVDTEEENEVRYIETIGTGHEIDSTIDLDFIDTYQVHDGKFVFHVFERNN